LQKTGFFRQVTELKIQRKNRGSALFTSVDHSSEEETELFANFRRYLIEYHLAEISSLIAIICEAKYQWQLLERDQITSGYQGGPLR
jgi:hypothetical protein